MWDAFYRLRKIKNRSTTALVAEYKYNGLGFRISIHEDTDSDGDVDGSDLWYHHAYDERWRWVATFRDTDSDPKEEFLHHGAGLDGFGGASYIDLVVYRDRDANTAWTSASDGTLEERIYYCQNWRADVSALVTREGTMLEWVKYSAYGVPFGLPGGDTDSDGDCDSTDVAQVQSWIDAPAYDVRGDVDLDGGVDSLDKSTIQTEFVGSDLGRGALSLQAVGNCIAFGGRGFVLINGGLYDVRRRALCATIGRWLSQDPTGYVDGFSLYQVLASAPLTRRDPQGLASSGPSGSCGSLGWGSCGMPIGPEPVDIEPKEPPPGPPAPPPMSPCQEACAQFQQDLDAGTHAGGLAAGDVYCTADSKTKCICVASKEQIGKYLAENLQGLTGGAPPSPEFQAMFTDCVPAHESAHLQNGDYKCSEGPSSNGKPYEAWSYGAGELAEPLAVLTGLGCLSTHSCNGDSLCQFWKDSWFTKKCNYLINAFGSVPSVCEGTVGQ